MEILLISVAFGAFSSLVTVFISKKINKAKFEVFIEQALFNQQVFIGLKAAKSTKEFYQFNANLTEEQIIERVSNAYFQVFTAQEQKNTLESSYSSTEKVRNVIKSLYDNGLSKKIDLDRTNVNLTNIETNIKQSNNGITQAENALKFYMGMPIETKIQLVQEDMAVTPHLLDETLKVSPAPKTTFKPCDLN